MSSDIRVTSLHPRVRRLKSRVARLKARVGRLKTRVWRLKARAEAIKCQNVYSCVQREGVPRLMPPYVLTLYVFMFSAVFLS